VLGCTKTLPSVHVRMVERRRGFDMGSTRQRTLAMSEKRFRCKHCGTEFSVPETALAKFPGWTPSQCLKCRKGAAGGAKPTSKPSQGGRAPMRGMVEENLTLTQVLERYQAGPDTGMFTDGSASPNPGPGGWGVVYVVDGEVIDQLHGHEPHTTNNRMELVALIETYKISPKSTPLDIFSDSELCVKTVNEWAKSWERNGWRRKGGPIKNLELVQELYGLAQTRKNITLKWIRAHDGSRWNEYADSLATAYSRKIL